MANLAVRATDGRPDSLVVLEMNAHVFPPPDTTSFF